MKSLHCPNRDCTPSKEGRQEPLLFATVFKTRWGKRRHYQCQTCGTTFCSTNGTAYYRLQHCRTTFDKVASLSVEGLNKSAIARAMRTSCNTVHRWLERAAAWCRRFNDRRIRRLSLAELQADEIQTILGGKKQALRLCLRLSSFRGGIRLLPVRLIHICSESC